MLLVIKCHFFHFLFSLKIRLEIRYNNFLDREETFLTIYKKELHNVSGHLCVNWSYLIFEMKREKPGRYYFWEFFGGSYLL